MKAKFAAIALLSVFSASLFAAPAPWHLWRSQLNGRHYCAQTPPGPGWELVGGPYKDSRCEKPGKPG
jgi:hypothetical protein